VITHHSNCTMTCFDSGNRLLTNRKMRVPGLLRTASLLLIFAVSAFSETVQPAQSQGVPTGTQTTTLPSQSEQPQGSAPLRVMVGKSLLINTTERLKRISVTDPAIAEPQVITPTQILVHGKTPGEVSLLIWDELERSRSFDLRVDVDVSACAEEEHRVPRSRSRSPHPVLPSCFPDTSPRKMSPNGPGTSPAPTRPKS